MAVDLVAAIRSVVDQTSVSNTCSDSRCKVGLQGIGDDRIIISLEKHCEIQQINKRRCDFLLAENGAEPSSNKIFLIELGKKDISTLKSQLEGGVSIVNDIVQEISPFLCVPVYARKPGMRKIENNELRKATILFRGQSLKIKPINCGDELSKALK